MAVDYSGYLQNQADLGWAAEMRQQATGASQAAYQQALARGENERSALEKAKFAWQQTLDKAGLTGMYEGQYTMPTQQWFASNFGTWAAPTAGQETMAREAQTFGQGQSLAGMYGQYYAPGTAPTAGMQTQAAQEQAYTQWLRAQQEARAQQTAQQQQAQYYLDLMSRLRGPADWAKYQQVLGATPGGMRDLVAASMGQYIPGGGATTGVAPQAATLQTLQQQIQPGYGQQQPGATTPQYGGQPGTGTAQEAAGGGTNTMGGATTPQYNLPAPNQIAAQSWKNLAPSQQQLMLGIYENQGWNKDDVTALMNQGLPKYAGNAPGAGTWRLQ